MIPKIPGVVLAEEIGAGGFATVYRGTQTLIGRDVAVKLDTRRLTAERDRRRFEREIQAAGMVAAHPNIVSLYDAGISEDSHPYLVMELCTGGSYGQRIKKTGAVPLEECIEVGIAIADALAAAHDQGILHRDVKPGNLLISQYGAPMLADFGLAVLPRPGFDVSVTLESLTPAYSAPETFALKPPTAAADIFGLGTTLYAMLQGRAPHSDASGQPPSLPKLLYLLNEPLPPLEGYPAADRLMQVIWRATAGEPQNRYFSAAAMRDALRELRTSPQPLRVQGDSPTLTQGGPATVSPSGSPSTLGQFPPQTTGPRTGDFTMFNALLGNQPAADQTGPRHSNDRSRTDTSQGSAGPNAGPHAGPNTGQHTGHFNPGPSSPGHNTGSHNTGSHNTGSQNQGSHTVSGPVSTADLQQTGSETGRLSKQAGAKRRGVLIAAAVAVVLIGGSAAYVIPRLSPAAGVAAGEDLVTETSGLIGAPTKGTANETETQTGAATTNPETTNPATTNPETSAETTPQTTASPTIQLGPPAVIGECFGGILDMADARSASAMDSCDEPHYYEVFAVGNLADETKSPMMNNVSKDPNVVATCTQKNLKDYLGNASLKDLSIEVLPPREALYYQGERAFRCLVTKTGAGEVTGSITGAGD